MKEFINLIQLIKFDKLHLFSLNEAKCPKYFLETMHGSFIKGRYFYNKKNGIKTAFVKLEIRSVD